MRNLYKNSMKWYVRAVLLASFVLMFACEDKSSKENSNGVIKFATCADYPPFEYYKDGNIVGFEIELAKMVAKKLKKNAAFNDMQYSSINAAVQNGSVDAAVATVTATEDRRKRFDFSQAYFNENLTLVYKNGVVIAKRVQLTGKKIACQLGSTMEIWLKKHAGNSEIIIMDNSNQVIEALKAGHVDFALLDNFQAKAFCNNNSSLSYFIIDKSDDGYAIQLKKGSPLKKQIDDALNELELSGETKALKQKWEIMQ